MCQVLKISSSCHYSVCLQTNAQLNPDNDWLVLALESNSWNWDEEISFFKVTEVLFEPEKKEKEG